MVHDKIKLSYIVLDGIAWMQFRFTNVDKHPHLTSANMAFLTFNRGFLFIFRNEVAGISLGYKKLYYFTKQERKEIVS